MPTVNAIRKKYRLEGKGSNSQAMRREIVNIVRSYVAAGMDDFDICAELDIKPSDLKVYKQELYVEESVQVAERKPVEVFIDYKLRMDHVCDGLDKVHKGATMANQFTAAMGALKAKASIIDKVIDRGQEMGVIARAAKKHQVVGGVAVASMSDEELLEKMRELSRTSAHLVDKYGDIDIIDVAVGDIYQEG